MGHDNYDKEIGCDINSDDELDDLIHYWYKIVANAFQENTNFVYEFFLISFSHENSCVIWNFPVIILVCKIY